MFQEEISKLNDEVAHLENLVSKEFLNGMLKSIS